MCPEGLGAGERLPADGAQVGTLPGVTALVSLECQRASESLTTLRAQVRPLARVRLLVFLELRGRPERDPAGVAQVQFFSSMGPFVNL